MVRVNLNAFCAARKSFMEAESSKKIRRALRSNVRTYADEEFVTGDNVYYRRQNCKGWHSPAKIFGKESQCVLIRHGGVLYRICLLMKVSKEFGSPRNEENNISSNEVNEVLEEEDERQQNKSDELKDNPEKPCRNTIVGI